MGESDGAALSAASDRETCEFLGHQNEDGKCSRCGEVLESSAASTCLVVGSEQEANRPGDATNAPGHDTGEVTPMPDNRNTVAAPDGIWRPNDRGHSFGYLTMRGVVVLRGVSFDEATTRYPRHLIVRRSAGSDAS